MEEDPRVVVPVDPSGLSHLVFDPTGSGWAVLWGWSRHPGLRVRLAQAEEDGPLVVSDLFLFGYQRITGRMLRGLPLSRIEAAVNQPDYRSRLLEDIRQARPEQWPEERILSDDDPRPWHLVPVKEGAITGVRKPRLTLSVPTGYGRPDIFYAQVADRYSYLTTVSRRPANALAEANGVPVTTVHGWIKEARKRGYLTRGERAKRGGTS